MARVVASVLTNGFIDDIDDLLRGTFTAITPAFVVIVRCGR